MQLKCHLMIKGNMQKNNCVIHTISLVIMDLLLLAVVSIGCCYTRDCNAQKMEFSIKNFLI